MNIDITKNLELGYTPAQNERSKSISEMGHYISKGVCYIDRIEYEADRGSHSPQMSSEKLNLPASDELLKSILTEDGIKEVRAILKTL